MAIFADSNISSASNAVAVVNDVAFSNSKALYVGVTGDISVVTESGATVVFKAVPQGTILPIRCTKVNSGGTVATNIVALI